MAGALGTIGVQLDHSARHAIGQWAAVVMSGRAVTRPDSLGTTSPIRPL